MEAKVKCINSLKIKVCLLHWWCWSFLYITRERQVWIRLRRRGVWSYFWSWRGPAGYNVIDPLFYVIFPAPSFLTFFSLRSIWTIAAKPRTRKFRDTMVGKFETYICIYLIFYSFNNEHVFWVRQKLRFEDWKSRM